jgi:hypothetical protein
MISKVELSLNPADDCRCASVQGETGVCRSHRDGSPSNPLEGWDWSATPLYKQLLLGVFFVVALLISDGSSTAAQAWEGSPPWYLPVGLTLALLLYGGRRCVPLVFLASIIAAAVNYHRPLLSWCGIPGAIAVYLGYVTAATILREWWPIDLRFGALL